MSDELHSACAKVGRYLYEFALLEREINQSIVQILELKNDPADVISHGLDFFKKVNILRIAAYQTAPKEDVSELDDLFQAIERLNQARVIMAHGAFEAVSEDAVQFRITSARGGSVKKKDPLWTQKMFEDAYAELGKTRERVKKIRPTLVFRVGEAGIEMLSAYSYGLLIFPGSGGGYY